LSHDFIRFDVFSAGAYREVFLSNLPGETVIFKAYYWGAAYSFEDMEFMRMDAIVAERLTWSPQIVDIYGFCGTGMINEAMENGDLEKLAVPTGKGRLGHALDDKAQLDVRNKLTGTKKLELSLEMAEAVLLLHSYPDGVIVHDDIQLSQYLVSADGTLKLNDFNRAEIMLFNEKDKEYCRYRNNPGHGDVSRLFPRWRRRRRVLSLISPTVLVVFQFFCSGARPKSILTNR
jgi:Protein tyrosine and serine/threonine kinase